MTGVIKSEPFILNIGPQHPSTHGVFRIKATVDGEKVIDAEMVMGYLHRSMEKLAEERTYTQNIPFTDRTDYLSSMSNNLGYCLAVEKLCGIDDIPPRAQAIRIILAELTRINSHLVWLGTSGLDLAAMSLFLYTMREREIILDIFELISGARHDPGIRGSDRVILEMDPPQITRHFEPAGEKSPGEAALSDSEQLVHERALCAGMFRCCST